jgi:murein DD-endopeptidase
MNTASIRSSPVVTLLLGVSLTLNVVLALRSPEPKAEVQGSAGALILPVVGAVTAQSPTPARDPAAPGDPAALDAPVTVSPAAPSSATVAASAADELHVVRAQLQGAIPQTLTPLMGAEGSAVSAVYSRLLMWDLDLRRDLRAGDDMALAYTMSGSGEAVMHAARYGSSRHGTTLTAYRFQASGDSYPSYWTAGGVEVPRRLADSPLDDYEQITSLIGDRPGHHGIDFKTPTGTPVRSPWDGVVTRANWNWRSNGNCLEVQYPDGVLAKFLHLSENRVGEGDRVRAGQVIALSGNTGRSTGPHLHYQLNRGDRVLDPLDIHGTLRRTLPEADREAFDLQVAHFERLFEQARLVDTL